MDGQHLHILWTNADPVVFDKMVLMYAVNSLVRGWWEKVTVILWGETARLAAADPAVRGEILGLYYLRQGAWGGAGAAGHGPGGHLLGPAADRAAQDPGAPADRVTETKKKLTRIARQPDGQ